MLSNSQLRQLDYLRKKELKLIEKARLPLQIRIQMIHNNAVDEKVLDYYDDVDYRRESGGTPVYNEQILTSEIGALNRIATQQDFNRLLKSSMITPDNISKLQAANKAKGLADKVTKVEVERALKNLNHIEKVLQSTEVQIDVYKNLITKLPRQVSRLDILEKALAKGENLKGKKLGFKEMDRMSKGLEGYKNNRKRLDMAIIENDQAQREGMGPLKSKKVWNWSQLENTRHEKMDNAEVDLYSKFTVTNEQNGDVDYLEFPRDIENDMNNCSNICNCQCEYEII